MRGIGAERYTALFLHMCAEILPGLKFMAGIKII